MDKFLLKRKKVVLKVPSRVHLNVMDIHKLNVSQTGGGGIGIALNMNSYIIIEVIDSEYDIIKCEKENLVKFYLNLMREILHCNTHFKVYSIIDKNMKTHSGMGSNVLIQSSIIYGINYLFGCPFSKREIVSIMQKNYREETGNGITDKVFCTGVAHNTFLFGGLCFVDENGSLIYTKKVDKDFKVAVLKGNFDYEFGKTDAIIDSQIVRLRKENDSNHYFAKKNNIIRNKIIPDLKNNKYDSFVEEMNNFTKEDDSSIMTKICKVKNITYDKLKKDLEGKNRTVMGISSNSPYVYVITDNIIKVKEFCKKNNVESMLYDINNNGIEVVNE